MDYKQKYEKALETVQEILSSGADLIRIKRLKLRLQSVFPELKENEDERIRKAIHIYLDWLDGRKDYAPKGSYSIKDMITWLEKQNKQNFSNIPSRETILAIWELGNDWKTLTKGVCVTDYGTQLEYIQNHWQESSYYNNIMGRDKK